MKLTKSARSIRPFSKMIEMLNLEERVFCSLYESAKISDDFIHKQLSMSHPGNAVYWTTARRKKIRYGRSHRCFVACDLTQKNLFFKISQILPISKSEDK